MELTEILFLGLVSVSIMFLFLSVLNFFIFIKKKEQLNTLRKAKGKKKRKRNKKLIKRLTKQKKRTMIVIVWLLFLGVATGFASVGMKYHMSTSLTKQDTELLVKAYFLIRDYEEELKKAVASDGEQEEVVKQLNYLSTSMASYLNKKPASINTVEGQQLLSRHYTAITQFGINTGALANSLYGNQQSGEEFNGDIERLKKNERAVFEYFDMDENRIKEK